MKTRICDNKHSRLTGFTLIEVLASLVILSIGLLGLAKLQMIAKQNNSDAIQRTSAAYLAKDILTRMRANPTVLLSYVTANGTNTLGGGSATIATEPSPACTAAATCTAAQLASHDLYAWEQAILGAEEGSNKGGLMSPTGCITGPNSGAAGVYTVAIAWRGQTKLVNPTTSTCGSATSLYGSANEYRRVVVIQTYIDSQL